MLGVGRESGNVDEGGRDVDVAPERVDARARPDARTPGQKGDVHVALVGVLLAAADAPLSEFVAVVRGEEDESVFENPLGGDSNILARKLEKPLEFWLDIF